MVKTKLLKVSYRDAANAISLTAYADTLVIDVSHPDKKVLIAIRFGGDPEPVRAMSDAIYGGGDIDVEMKVGAVRLSALTKQYKRQISRDGVYAEASLTALDDAEASAKKKTSAGQESREEQTEIELPPRTCYFYCPQGDDERLFEDIDRKVGVPLIPEFREYFLDALRDKGILRPLNVWSCHDKFDVWALRCSKDDKNLADVLDEGLRKGKINIPGAAGKYDSAFDSIDGVTSYLREFGVSMANKIKARFTPLFDPAAEKLSAEIMMVNKNIFEHTGYSLYDAQLACAEALKRKVMQRQPALIVAECGSGKTKIGATALYAAHLAENRPKSFNVVMCPSHVTHKWVREIEETIPDSFGGVIRGITDMQRFYAVYKAGNRSAFAVISKEKARDGYMKAPSVRFSKRKGAFLCPRCYKPVEMDVVDGPSKYRTYADSEFFMNENSKNHKCEHCGEVMWSPLEAHDQTEWVKIGDYGFVHRKFAYRHLGKRNVRKSAKLRKAISEVSENPDGVFIARGAYRAFPLSTYIRRHMKGKIDGFIADELHQYAQNSGQGDAMAEVAAAADKVIGMTATLINGYSSGIFHLLWRLFARFMLMDLQQYDDPKRFDREYGVLEETYEVTTEAGGEYNSNRRTSKRKLKERLLPGVSPLVYARFLLEHAVFLSLMDMGKDLPEYEEFPIPLAMTEAVKKEYERLQNGIKNLMTNRKIASKIQSAAMNLLTVYPDQPYGLPPIEHPFEDDKVLIVPRDTATFEDSHQKELKLLELLERKISAGERVLIYTSWVRIDTQDKLKKLLGDAGYKTAVLTVSKAPEEREQWVANQVADGVKVLITNPSLVETGLDLNDFTTLIYYNIGYNLFTLRQSSRRSWRINQTAPRIEVFFFTYRGTIQERALSLMASKLSAAGLIEGQVTDEGLAAMSDCRDLTSQLAKELARGIREEVEDLSGVFKRMAILKTDEEKAEFTKRHAAAKQMIPGAFARIKDDMPDWRTEFTQTTFSTAPQQAAPMPPVAQFPEVLPKMDTARSEPTVVAFAFTAPRGKRTKIPTQLEDQLSLFDMPA